MKFLMLLLAFITLGAGNKIDSYSYYKDDSKSLTIKKIKAVNFVTTKETNLGSDNGVYWFKIDQLPNERSILELRTSHVNSIELYDSNMQVLSMMDNTRFPSFFLINRRIQYPLYFKANFPLETYFPMYVSTEGEFAVNDKNSFLGIGFFYGTAIALIIATLTFYFIVKNRQFLLFAGLVVAIILSMLAKDNILYFLKYSYTAIVSIEAIGHFMVGLTATGYMMFFIKLRSYQKWIKWSMLSLSLLSLISLIAFIITKEYTAFVLINVFGLLSVALIWVITLMISKGFRRIALLVVYSINLFILVDLFIFHLFAVEILKIGIKGIGILSLANFTLIATLLLVSFRNLQARGVIMKHRIKLYLEQIKELGTYKNVQDANDDYMESLIYQFDLKNIEVNILGDISNGLSNKIIANKYDLTEEKLQTITNNLYKKLGLDSSTDLNQLS